MAASRIVIGAVLTMLSIASCFASEESVFFVRGVTTDPSCISVGHKELALACHRFERGDELGVALRRYRSSRKIDRDTFEKLTVTLPLPLIEGAVLTIHEPRLRVFYSKGASSFPGKVDCYSQANSGQVKIVAVSRTTVAIDVDAEFDLKSPLGWKGDCKPINLRQSFRANVVSFESLDAWEGNPREGDSILDEAKPKWTP